MRFLCAIGLVVLGLASWIQPACAQDSAKNPGENRSSLANAIEKIQKEFAAHLEKRKKLEEKYQEIDAQLKKSETDLQQINAEGMRQQLAIMQSQMQSMQLTARLQWMAGTQGTGTGTGNGTNQGNNAIQFNNNLAQMQLLQNQFLQDLNTTLRGEELRRLDAKSQQVIRSRIEAVQAAVKLEQDWNVWLGQIPGFLDRYWPVSDPEFRYAKSEIEAALAVLEKRHDDDIAAKLASVWLMFRSGRNFDALSELEPLVKNESTLQPIALMTKAMVLNALDKDKESKQAMQGALKLDKANVYLRWVRARLAASQEQWAIAESEWRFLATVKPMEKEARRSLALVHAMKASKSPGEGIKGAKEAQLALDLETIPTWYSHYVIAVCYAGAKKKADAETAIDKAIELAGEDFKELCEATKEKIVAGTPIKIDFVHGVVAFD